MRPFTLTASIAPVLVGTGLAFSARPLRINLFIAMLAASMLIQGVANMVNEYYDYKRGLDTHEMVGIAGAIVRDGMQPRTVKAVALFTLGMSVLLGVYICAQSSWWVAVAGSLSIFVMYLYSAGPLPLSYTPFGEVTAGTLMGPVIVLIAYFIQTGSLTSRALYASLPIGLLIAAILLANNIRDREHDLLGGRKTLPILVGRKAAVRVLSGVFGIAFALDVWLVAARILTPWALIALLAYAGVPKVVQSFRATTVAAELHAAVKGTSLTLFRFGFLLFLGLAIGARPF